MKPLNDQQLNARIESFIAKKDQQFPELALVRKDDQEEPEPISQWLADRMSVLIESLRPIRLAH